MRANEVLVSDTTVCHSKWSWRAFRLLHWSLFEKWCCSKSGDREQGCDLGKADSKFELNEHHFFHLLACM